MIAKLWLWVPFGLCCALGLIFAVGAWFVENGHTHPRQVSAKGFTGIVRESAKLTLLGSGAGWITAILSKELTNFPFVKQLLAATLLVSLIAATLNYYLAAATDTATSGDGKTVTVDGKVWPTVHGAVFGMSLGASIALVVAAFAFATSI